ncbi:MAG TPA: hypothetical protein VFA10_05190 [Ktedonobacteraceae bacterium]|nr:hypothetical protein [Ktedonobacteraceae bacterium]
MGGVTVEHIQAILINPFYAIQVAPELVETHEPAISDEEWVRGNVSLIVQEGAEQWVASLLDVLEGSTTHELVNPSQAITIDPTFALEHPPVWPKEQWIESSVRLLLDVLEGDFVTNEDIQLAAPPEEGCVRYRLGRPKSKKRKKHKR